MIAISSFFFFNKKEPFLKGVSLISENDGSHFDTGRSEKGWQMGWAVTLEGHMGCSIPLL